MAKLVGRRPIEIKLYDQQDGRVPVFDSNTRLWTTINKADIASGSAITSGSNRFIGDQIFTGSLYVSSSIVVGEGITGSLFGTASYASNAWAIGGNTFTGGDSSRIIGTLSNHDLSVFISGSRVATFTKSGSLLLSPNLPNILNNEKILIDAGETTSFNLIRAISTIDNYSQFNINNQSSGSTASSDIVATADNGSENSNYIDMGINSSGFAGEVGDANDAYLYSTGNDLHIGNASNHPIQFFAGGLDNNANRKLQLNPNNLHQMTGSLDISGSVVAHSFTGSLQGTSSVAVSSSYALTASYIQNAQTASYVNQAQSASYWSGSILNATSASFATNALSASYWSGSIINAATASYVQNAQSASYVLNAISSSYAATASSADNFLVRGTLTAQTIVAQTITSSTDFVTGSTINGSLLIDTHQFTGSVGITGSLTVNGSNYLTTSGSASTRLTNLEAFSGSYSTGSFTGSFIGRHTGSFSGSLANLQNSIVGHIPFFSSSQVLADSIAMQIDNGGGSYSIAINQNGVTTAAPEALYVWQPSTTSYNVISGKGNLDNYLQLNIQNVNTGPSASSDVVATANNGTETTYYVDMGINGENYINNGNGVGNANDAYLYSTGNHLHIGNASNSYVGFFAGGFDVDTNMKLLLSPDNKHEVTGSLKITEGVTGSLHGTASWATNAINANTSSYIAQAQSASYVLNAVSASFAATASRAINSNQASTVSISGINTNAEYTFPLIATGSSGPSIGLNIDTATGIVYNPSTNLFRVTNLTATGSLSGTSSYAAEALTSSYAATASYWSGSIINAATASYVETAKTASYVLQAVSASYATNALYASTASSADDFTVRGTLTVQTINAQTITSSIEYVTGSTQFGSILSNTHQFTGSVSISGSLQVNGSNAILANQTSSMSVLNANTASYVNQAQSASYWSGSITNAASASYVETAQTASYVLNAISASYWSGSIINAESASYATTSSYALFVDGISNGTASIALTASYVENAQTASYALNAISASYWSGSIINVESASYATQASSASYWSGSIINAESSSYANNATTASYVLNAVSASYATNADLLDGKDSTIFATTGSNVFVGNQTITGSFLVSGSTTQIGNNTLLGNTTLSGSIVVTGSVNALANINLGGTLRLDPAEDPGTSNLTASFLFTSASNTDTGFDLYYRQNDNIVKFKWLEGMLNTGILYGGVLTYSSSYFYLSSGSGIIVNHNATTGSEVSPIITYVNWNASTHSIANTGSQNTYVFIDSNGDLQQQTSFFTAEQYHDILPIGRVSHYGDVGTTITGVGNNILTAYDVTQQLGQFTRAFGPLKISGFTITPQVGNLSLNIGSGTAFNLGGYYQTSPDLPSTYNSNTYLTSSIIRLYRSGSGFKFDNNGGSYYTSVDPTLYDDGTGTLASVGNGNWSIQRVFVNPQTGRSHVYYGQTTYPTYLNAVSSVATDDFVESEVTKNAYVFAGYLVMNGNASNTDLSVGDPTNAIVQAGLFRNSVGGSGGATTAVSELNDLSDVNISSPSNGQALIYSSGTWINGTPVSASTAISSSHAIVAVSASYFSGSVSDAITAISASYAVTASYLLGQSPTSSYALTASYVENAQSASFAITASYLLGQSPTASYALTASYADNFTVGGTLTVQTLVAQTVTSSVAFVTGSTKNGSLLANTHQFTGSVSVTGSLSVNGSNVIRSNQTSSMSVATASFATSAISASHAATASSVNRLNQSVVVSGSLTVTGSTNIVGDSGATLLSSNADTLIFTGSLLTSGSIISTGSLSVLGGITGSHFGTSSYATQALSASYWSGSITNAATASYVVQAQSASYWSGSITNAASASYASNADLLDGKDSSIFATTGSNTFIGNQTISGSIGLQRANYIRSEVPGTGTVNLFGLDDGYQVVIGASGIDAIITNNRIKNRNGSEGSPSYTFEDSNTGLYRIGEDDLGITAGGVTQVSINTTRSLFNSPISASSGITGSLFGTAATASYVQNAISASYWSGSILNATSASYANNSDIATSASYAATASYILGSVSGFPFSGSAVITGSLLVSQSFVDFTQASYVTGSFTGSFNGTVATSSYALYAANAPGTTATFTQSAAATTWSFTHNLNTRNPLLQVYDSNNYQIVPAEIFGSDPNQALIYFDTAESGYAVASNGGGLTVSGSTARLDQTSAAVTWSFTHNLATKYPNFEIWDSNDNVIIPAGIHAIDDTSAEIYFSYATTGVAIASFSGIAGSPNAAYATSASYAATASIATSASYAATSSYATNFTVANTLIIDQTLTDYQTVASSIVGTNNVFTRATGSYTSAFVKYTVSNGANARSGEIITVWNGTTTQYVDNSTLDIGDTSDVVFSTSIVSSEIQVNAATTTSGWKIKAIGTFM